MGRTVIGYESDQFGQKPIFGPATCDRCKEDVPYVWKDTPNLVPNLSDALDLTISGGYGEYVDLLTGRVNLVLCERCCDALMVFLKISKDQLYSMEI